MTGFDSAVDRFRAAPRRTASEAVVLGLRDAIRSGRMQPGDRLVQSDVAEQFGVSVTPVREALHQLSAEGLIDFDPFRGAVVRAPGRADVIEVYLIFAELAPLATRQNVPLLSAAQVEELERLHRAMQATDDLQAWLEGNRWFHHLLEDNPMSPRLSSMLKSLRDMRILLTVMTPENYAQKMRDSDDEHEAIMECVRRRDGEGAALAVRAHLESSLDHLQSGETSATA